MGYIGREPTNSGEFLLIDNISGDFDGSESSFTLKVGTSKIMPAAANTVIALDGVLQEPSSSYSISGSTITFTAAPDSTVSFYGVLAGQSQYITNYSITDDHISLTANISGSKINTNFGAQSFQLTAITASANVSGSSTSTGSFGRLELSASLSASATSTGSFGAVYVGGMTNSNLLDVSSSLSTRVTTEEGNVDSLQTDSGSFSTMVTTTEASGALFDGTGAVTFATVDTGQGANELYDMDQNVKTDSNVTFGNVTATGTMTAEEFHTEFVSASITYVSGSTKFGDTSDDVHSFTGSIHLTNSGSVSGSIFSTGSFGAIYAGGMSVPNLINVSSSFSTRVTSEEGNVDSLQTDSGSFSTRVGLLEGSGSITESSASFSTRATTLENANISGGFVAQTVLSGSGTLISGSVLSTGSFGRVIIAEMGNSDLTVVSSSTSTRTTTLENANISGGFVAQTVLSGSGTLISGSVLSTGSFGALRVTSPQTLTIDNKGTVSGSATSTGSFGRVIANTADINGGTLDGATIGATSATTIKGTTIDATTDFTIGGTVITDNTITDDGTLVIASTTATSFSDGNITNVGDISLDSISSDAGTSINVDLGSDAGDDFTVDTSKLVVEGNTGRVGIGTASPDGDLDVRGSTGYVYFTTGIAGAGQAQNLIFRSGSVAETLIGQIEFSGNANGSSQIVTRNTSNLKLGTNNTVAMTISGSGQNVGIGTTSPVTNLHISEGTAGGETLGLTIENSDTSTSTDETVGLSFRHRGRIAGKIVSHRLDEYDNSGEASAGLKFYGVNSESYNLGITIDHAGKVGIGTGSPAVGLDVHWDNEISAGFGRANDATNFISIRTAETADNLAGIAFMVGSATQTGVSSPFQMAGVTAKVINADNSASLKGELGFYTNSGDSIVQKMVIDKDGKVGIGTATPTSDFGFTPLLHLKKDGDLAFVLDNATEKFEFCMNDNTDTLRIHAGAIANIMTWDASSGNVGFGTTGTPNGTSIYGSAFVPVSYNRSRLAIACSNAGDLEVVQFFNPNGQVGSISTNGSATDFTTSSDYRLKENEVLISDGLTRLNQLKPYRFNFKSNADRTVDGFFAHEVSGIVPDAIHGEKDAVDDDGNAKMQGIDHSKLVPLLVSAVQELSTANAELKSRIEVLENA